MITSDTDCSTTGYYVFITSFQTVIGEPAVINGDSAVKQCNASSKAHTIVICKCSLSKHHKVVDTAEMHKLVSCDEHARWCTKSHTHAYMLQSAQRICCTQLTFSRVSTASLSDRTAPPNLALFLTSLLLSTATREVAAA
jgi:hypothetical protein